MQNINAYIQQDLTSITRLKQTNAATRYIKIITRTTCRTVRPNVGFNEVRGRQQCFQTRHFFPLTRQPHSQLPLLLHCLRNHEDNVILK